MEFRFMKFLKKIQVNFLFFNFNFFIGIWEGKLLERGNYKNSENNFRPFTISDFETNKSIKINSFSFHIVDADDFTKKWMLENLI